jgi:hypothetical protein
MVFGMGNCTKSKLPKKYFFLNSKMKFQIIYCCFSEIIISIVGLDDAGKTTSVKVIKGG